MLRVALTGGIGTGKSTVLARWRELGAAVIEADRLAHQTMAAGTDIAVALRARFGPEVARPDGAVDRSRLAALVFDDVAARRDLESLVHPAVYAAIEDWLVAQAADGRTVAVAEIPLLFETGHEGDFDIVVVTTCDEAEQIRRLVDRGVPEADARRRRAAQWPIGEKVRRAQIVIRTDGTIEQTRTAAAEAWRQLLDRASALGGDLTGPARRPTPGEGDAS